FFIRKKLVFDLVDEVWDDGAALIVKDKGREDRIALSNIVNISYSPLVNPPRVTLTLRQPTNHFGTEISFSAPIRFVPFAKSELIEELIRRVDAARRKSGDRTGRAWCGRRCHCVSPAPSYILRHDQFRSGTGGSPAVRARDYSARARQSAQRFPPTRLGVGRRPGGHAAGQCDAARAVHDFPRPGVCHASGRRDPRVGARRGADLDPGLRAGGRCAADRRGRTPILVALPALAVAALNSALGVLAKRNQTDPFGKTKPK